MQKKIKDVHDKGYQIGIVIGGGNIFRGMSVAAKGMDRVAGDYLGMMATIMNSVALQSSLEKLGADTRVMSAITITQLAEPYIRRKAARHLEKGRIVIMAGGTGNPYFTTDTAAVLRGIEINADVIMKGTKVDGVYDKDPMKFNDAIKYEKLSYKEVVEQELKVMDLTAVTLCKENNFPILVFDLEKDNFIGKEALKNSSKKCRTWGLRVEKGTAMKGKNLKINGQIVGEITSSTWSPYQVCGVGIVRMQNNNMGPGTVVDVNCTNGKIQKGELCELPMYDPNGDIVRGKNKEIPNKPNPWSGIKK